MGEEDHRMERAGSEQHANMIDRDRVRRDSFLPFSLPDVGEDEIAEVVETLRSGWLTTGPRVHAFERAFSAFVGAPALPLSSCTAALHCALLALGIGAGDSVVVPTMTFVSGAHVVEHCGARLVLVDVEPDTLCIDPERLEEVLRREPSVRAIMPVHLYGHTADLDAIDALADRFGCAVIEDAAHALPARTPTGTLIGSRVRTAGGQPVLTAFSFYATKNLCTGEGGMLTGPEGLIEEARAWSLHGIGRDAWSRYHESSPRSWGYEISRPGFKYNLTDIQAALGLVQLRRLPAMHARRVEIAAMYDAALGGLPGITLPARRPGVMSAWHIYAVRLDAGLHDRDAFMEALREANIATSVHFIPVHSHRYYRERDGYTDASFPVASKAFTELVSLPMTSALTDADVLDVIGAVRRYAADPMRRPGSR